MYNELFRIVEFVGGSLYDFATKCASRFVALLRPWGSFFTYFGWSKIFFLIVGLFFRINDSM